MSSSSPQVSPTKVRVSDLEAVESLKIDNRDMRKRIVTLEKDQEKLKKLLLETSIKSFENFRTMIVEDIKTLKPRINVVEGDLTVLVKRMDSISWDLAQMATIFEEFKEDVQHSRYAEVEKKVSVYTVKLNDLSKKVKELTDSQISLSTKIIEEEHQRKKKIQDILENLTPFQVMELKLAKIEQRLDFMGQRLVKLDDLEEVNEELHTKVDAIDMGAKLAKLKNERRRIEDRIDTFVK